ncbi:serine hydrolase domain-containing protein [Paraburkholderia fungorum]|uniref:serine hydrolase domain-containing protein n=1 Tax=Paraburkholderia fungorum TaxID=134537 RepID=UPI0038B7C4DA
MFNDQAQRPLAQPKVHLPNPEHFLMWPPCLQSYGYRIVDQLFATRTIERGKKIIDLPRAPEVEPNYEVDGQRYSVGDYMDRNNVVGLLVIKDGHVILERYGLGLAPGDRWSTMSTVKSMTAMLVGAALQDGAVESLDDRVADYIGMLEGSCYEHVTVRHLLTMSSGVEWVEVYPDPHSHVNHYSRSLANKVPGGVLQLMKGLRRAHAPGTVWNYNTGDTYLLGALVSAATRQTLASYMSEKIWKPCGMEFDAFYTLESDEGQEIGGSRAGMTLRDIGRFALFVMNDGIVGERRILPHGWVDEAQRRAFELPEEMHQGHNALRVTGYGYSWWLTDDRSMIAMGHCGQRIYINRAENLIVVNLAAHPEPQFAPPGDHNRDADLRQLVEAYRGSLSTERYRN